MRHQAVKPRAGIPLLRRPGPRSLPTEPWSDRGEWTCLIQFPFLTFPNLNSAIPISTLVCLKSLWTFVSRLTFSNMYIFLQNNFLHYNAFAYVIFSNICISYRFQPSICIFGTHYMVGELCCKIWRIAKFKVQSFSSHLVSESASVVGAYSTEAIPEIPCSREWIISGPDNDFGLPSFSIWHVGFSTTHTPFTQGATTTGATQFPCEDFFRDFCLAGMCYWTLILSLASLDRGQSEV